MKRFIITVITLILLVYSNAQAGFNCVVISYDDDNRTIITEVPCKPGHGIRVVPWVGASSTFIWEVQ